MRHTRHQQVPAYIRGSNHYTFIYLYQMDEFSKPKKLSAVHVIIIAVVVSAVAAAFRVYMK
jgi:hypothetical protein